MKRIPMTYEVSDAGEELIPAVIDDTEFAQFIAGKREDITPASKRKLRAALKSSDMRVSLFLAAYAQRNMGRLARLMRALDTVDREVLQEWRLKTMDNSELLSLYSELSMDRTRSVKELLDISGKPAGGRVDPSSFLDDSDEVPEGAVLSKKSKLRVADFYDRVVVKKK